MTYRVVSNLFDRHGHLDLDGDEDQVNVGSRVYDTPAGASHAAERLGEKYLNAYVDIKEDRQ